MKTRIALVVLAFASAALAGTKINWATSTGNSSAYGTIANSRSDTRPDTFIGCEVTRENGRTAARVNCSAKAVGPIDHGYVGCTSTDPSMVATAQALTANAMVDFGFDSNGTCTRLTIGTWSWAPPVAP